MGEAKRKTQSRAKAAHEIERHFLEQWNFLVSSSLGYDNGHQWEAVRIAGSVATFCNDGSSQSLLTLADFGRAHSGRLLDSAGDVDERNMLDDHPLVGMMMGPHGTEFTCLLDAAPCAEWIRFGAWWSRRTVVRFAADNSKFRRADVILAVRNAEGYGHVQRNAEPLVDAIGADAPAKWQAFRDGLPERVRGSILGASVRQIGHELIRSLQQFAPALISDGLQYPDDMDFDYQMRQHETRD